MSRSSGTLRNALLAIGAIVGLTAQTSHAQPAATPPATTSADCPAPSVATHQFLTAASVPLRTPRGVLSLVPVNREATRERGLMCVIRIPPGKGMLFVFAPPEREQDFWMKNTLVALDMVFISATGVVSAIAADVPPTPNGTPDDAVTQHAGFGQFVIELGAGDAARHGIVRGTKMTLPALTAQQ